MSILILSVIVFLNIHFTYHNNYLWYILQSIAVFNKNQRKREINNTVKVNSFLS